MCTCSCIAVCSAHCCRLVGLEPIKRSLNAGLQLLQLCRLQLQLLLYFSQLQSVQQSLEVPGCRICCQRALTLQHTLHPLLHILLQPLPLLQQRDNPD